MEISIQYGRGGGGGGVSVNFLKDTKFFVFAVIFRVSCGTNIYIVNDTKNWHKHTHFVLKEWCKWMSE